ncbi:hypothetical protein LINPERHAP2_LOCUS19180, partial [Linum perenne]
EDASTLNTQASVVLNRPPVVPTAPENNNIENQTEEVVEEVPNEVDNAITKGRGKNKCATLAKLKQGEKLSVDFFQRRAV